MSDDELFDEVSVLPYLATRDIDTADARAWLLGGGVSNVVIAVDAGEQRLVLKQSRSQLQVAEEWFAPRERIVREAEGLRLLGALEPGTVPGVIDLDPDTLTLTLERAPDSWTDWKAALQAGDVEAAIAAELGRVLGSMQQQTHDGAGLPADLIADVETFELLRLAPYHRTAAERNPAVAADVLAVVARMEATRHCLVHGDFSPKNILVGDGSSWIIDFEVAHFGDPTFDPAFLASHLLLKSVHHPQLSDDLAAASAAFFTGLESSGASYDIEHLSRQIGCLLLARVDGKSPAEYLSDDELPIVHALGIDLLTNPITSTQDLWRRLERTPR